MSYVPDRYITGGKPLPAGLDADRVIRGLYMGGRPEALRELRDFHVVVFCAEEYQPDFGDPRRTLLIYAPFDDTRTPSPHEVNIAVRAGERVAELLDRNRRCLVTCYAGLNRSGLVTGIAVRKHTHLPTSETVDLIRAARGRDALSNPGFVQLLKEYRP